MFDKFRNRKRDLLLEKIRLQKEEAHNNGRFSIFDTNYASNKINDRLDYYSLENIYTILNGWESNCNIPLEVGQSLNVLMNDNTVMIHRTNLGLDTSANGLDYNSDLVDIMKGGLINQGHINAGGGGAILNNPPALTLTMTSLEGLSGFIDLISSYKNNDSVVIAAFPKELINKDGELIKGHDYSEIYDLDKNPPRVKSQFIFGVLLKKEKGLDEFYTRDQVIEASKSNTEIKSANL